MLHDLREEEGVVEEGFIVKGEDTRELNGGDVREVLGVEVEANGVDKSATLEENPTSMLFAGSSSWDLRERLAIAREIKGNQGKEGRMEGRTKYKRGVKL